MLIKKTIILSDGVKAVGHLSIIRVGQETGAKLVLSVPYDGGYLGLKMGNKKQENFRIEGLKQEWTLLSSIEPNDQIGCIITRENKVVASGGLSGIVSEKIESEEEEENVVNQVKEQPEVEEGEPKVEESECYQDVDCEEDEGEIVKEEGGSEKEFNPFVQVKGENFYRSIKSKLNEIMTANPREKKLEELIPDSKWVRVYYEKGEYYVVGILTEDGEVTFLAYGVPGVRRVKPPKEAEELCDFVEVESSIGDGYWIMFQNAKSGEIVKSI